jgi:probable selenium-dependent hydroxylase accessory protein YqeC
VASEELGEAMQLKDAIGLSRGESVSLIGAGGKTTTMFRLAQEMREEGERVLVTTTTKIFKPTKPHVDKLFLVEDVYALLQEAARLDPPIVVGAGTAVDDDGKLLGLPVRWLDEIEKNKVFDSVLIEADGAASRLFKIASDIEPVVPASCRLTIWVMAIKILGKPLEATWVHRPERLMALTGARPGAVITQELILRLVQHPEGSLKGVPPGSRKVALINQADSAEEIESARVLANALLGLGIERVVVTSFNNASPVQEMISQQPKV